VEVVRAVVFGMWCLLECWLRRSSVSNTINTSFVERNNLHSGNRPEGFFSNY
jgi:hypothetical protein